MRASAALLLLLVPSVARAQLTCGSATVETRTLRYCTGGNGKAAVVFESGAAGTTETWDSAATRIAAFARVITYDRAGHGESPPSAGGRAPGDIATDLLRLLDRIGERDPVVLVGHADGSWFVREFANRFPDRVRAIVLVDPPHEEFEIRARALLSPEERAQRDSSLAMRLATGSETNRREHEGILQTPSSEWSRPLPEVPLVVLSAGRHDFAPASRSAELETLWAELGTALAGRVADGRVKVIASGGAELPRTQSEAIAREVREVITRSEPQDSEGISLGTWLAILSLVLGVPGAISAVMQIRKWRAAHAPRPEPVPHQVTMADLIGKHAPAAGRAVALLRAANMKAGSVIRAHLQGAPVDPVADAMWSRTWPESDWRAQRAWVEPYDGPGRASALTQEVLRMLRTARGAGPDGNDPHRIWLLGPAGAGKSTFMNRLFFEALGVSGAAPDDSPGLRPLPVPMFVQSRNVGVQQILRLRDAGDGFPAFIEGWLANRKIEVPAEARAALVADFAKAIGDGEIALFIDGFDELVDLDLVGFLHDLLGRSACWVSAERSDRRLSRTGTSMSLPAAWSLAHIERHLEVRWPDRPAWRTRVLGHLRKETDGDHVLRVPRYLDLFLGRLESSLELPDESDLRELSRGGPELAAAIVALAMARLPATGAVTEHDINARLFGVAAARVLQADFVLAKGARDATWSRILQMTEFVAHVVTPDGYNVRITHPALVDYFLAGQIANELRTDSAPLTQGDRHWSRGLLAGVSAWLRRSSDPTVLGNVWHRIRIAADGAPVANLLELAIQMEVDAHQNARRDVSERDRRRQVTIADKDLARRNLASAELRLVTFARCRFNGANLSEADLQHATFHDCDFAGADLTGANAYGAEFARCLFRDSATSSRSARVEQLQIEAAEFHEGTDAASDVAAAWLEEHGATRTRTRYGGEFGRLFFSRQAAFLGPVAESLEKGAYRERITAALARCPGDKPVTLIDLMAGGGNEWLAGLVTSGEGGAPRFPGLRVLGIDRDEPQLRELKRQFPDVFKWYQMEIGDRGIDFPAIIGEVFARPGDRLEADLIVAKKAIHELRRALQPRIIAQCFAGLRPGGELILFADSPGGLALTTREISEEDFAQIDTSIRGLLLDPDTPLAAIRAAVVTGVSFAGGESDQARFCNLWVMLKDWANDNLHEVRNRWFSSAGEIRQWALEAGFSETGPPSAARYRIAVARFNEHGIQRVVHHLERNGPGVIQTDGSMLADWLSASGDERQALLLEFSAHHLTPGSDLERALNARTVNVDWGVIHEDLRKLTGGGRETISFEFPVHVLGFAKGVEGSRRETQ